MNDAPGPSAIDVGATTGWIVGCCVASFSLAVAASVLFEWFVYDVPEASAWWDIEALVGALAAWTTLMWLVASRVRFDHDGIHRRSIWRRRHWAWAEVDELAVRSPRIRVLTGVVAFRTGEKWRETPWGVNTHPGGAVHLLELAAPLAIAGGVESPTSNSERAPAQV